MHRRTLLRWLASIGPLRAWAQTAGFPGDQGAALRTLAAVVLPSELGAAGLERSVAAFERWVREYRPGAEMDHGYGFTRLRSKPPSPASAYLQQLQALRLTGDPASRRAAVEGALEEAKITALPQSPDGRHIAADLMAFYFRSSEANDLCYRAHIGRDECRGLAGSEKGAPLMRRFESDVCIIGGGITAALLSQKLRELRPGISITVVEAGSKFFDLAARTQARDRMIKYAENPWPGDFVEDQAAKGVISRTMAVGGSALHWGGTCNRFSEEDLRLKSMYGLHVDWPLEWAELEKFYCEAERRLGVSGEPSPLPEDRRSEPYPMAAMAMTHNLIELKKWAQQSGIPFWTTPQAKNTKPYDGRAQCIRCNTCSICPIGARYSPDFTFQRLLAGKNFTLHERTLVRKLVLDESKPTVAAAQAVSRDAPDDPIEYRAPVFVLASGYCWSPHLLLLSKCSRFPEGLANTSQLVGRYMCGHAFISAQIEIDAKIYPGMNEQHGLISRQFFRCKSDAPFIRHDLRVWESAAGHDPRLRSADGRLLLGDSLLADWRERAKRGTARVRGYYDVHPDRDSSLTLDDTSRNKWGDPMPKIEHKPDAASQARLQFTRDHFQQLFRKLAEAGNGKILSTSAGNYWDHPAGGCRMGSDPSTSVCDSFGQTHDHENLFVAGSPTLPNAGCTNGTLTFVALTLRSAQRIAAHVA